LEKETHRNIQKNSQKEIPERKKKLSFVNLLLQKRRFEKKRQRDTLEIKIIII